MFLILPGCPTGAVEPGGNTPTAAARWPEPAILTFADDVSKSQDQTARASDTPHITPSLSFFRPRVVASSPSQKTTNDL